MSFTNLNRFRQLNGSDNLFGGLDCLKLDPGYVIILTNTTDMDVLQRLESCVLDKRWD
jgi:hypothetical protein